MSEKTFAEFERLTQQSAQLSLRLSEVDAARETLRKELLGAITRADNGVVTAQVLDNDSHGIPEHIHTEVTVPVSANARTAPEANAQPVKRKGGFVRLSKPALSPGELRAMVLEAVHAHGAASVAMVVAHTKRPAVNIKNAILRYVASGHLKRVGRGQYSIGMRAHAEA